MIPTWVAVVTGISLAILALSAIAIALSSVIAALGVRAFLRVFRELAGPALGDVRQLVTTIRTEAEGLVGTSQDLRGRIVRAADAAEARLADLDALFEVVQEEVETTALDAAASRCSNGVAGLSNGGGSTEGDGEGQALARRGGGRPGRDRPLPRRGARLDAGHPHLFGRVRAREPAPAPRRGGRLAARVPLRFSVRQHRGRHVDREEVRARGTPLPRVARGSGDSRPRARGPAPGLRLGLSLAPRGRYRGAQFLRPASAGAHLEHDRAGPQLLGEPLRDAPRRRVRPGSEGCHPAGPCAERRPPRFHHLPNALQHAHQPPAVPRDGAPHRERKLALGLPADPREHALGPARCRRGAPHGGGVRIRDGDAGRGGRRGTAARPRWRAGARARQAHATHGAPGGRPGGSRTDGGDGRAALRTADAGPGILEAVAGAAAVAR